MFFKPEAEEVVSTATVYSGRLLKVKKMEVKLSGRAHLREVVEHPGAVALIPILGDEIILIRQFRLAAGRMLYEIPAGTLGRAEIPEKCAARELAEETGYVAGRLEMLLRCFLAPGYSTEVVYFYLATELRPSTQRLEEDESIEVCPTPLRRAFEMAYTNEIEDAKTLLGIMLCQRYLSS